MIVLAAASFAACSKDNGNDGPKMPAKQTPYLLYYDAATQTLAAGQWGTVNPSNMLLFKFGSVVGFTATSEFDDWGAGDVKFNPTGASYAAYGNVPCYDGDGSEGDGYTSSVAYHNGANVKAGLGDPCKLVGLKANASTQQIEAHNSGLRLPTNAELSAMYNENNFEFAMWLTETTINFGWKLSESTDTESYLSISVIRDEAGFPKDPLYTQESSYWTGDPLIDTEQNLCGTALHLDVEDFTIGQGHPVGNGFPVRCVAN